LGETLKPDAKEPAQNLSAVASAQEDLSAVASAQEDLSAVASAQEDWDENMPVEVGPRLILRRSDLRLKEEFTDEVLR